MPSRPDPAESGRVSPTAPESQSASNNVWRLLANTPGVREAIRHGRQQIADGDTVSVRELREEHNRGR